MIFTLGELKIMEPVLQKLNEATVMDISTAYRLAKFLKAVATELQTMEELRIKLVERFGVTMEDGAVKVCDANIPDFHHEYTLLAETTVSIPFAPIPVSKLGSVGLAPRDLIMIEKILTEAEPAEK